MRGVRREEEEERRFEDGASERAIEQTSFVMLRGKGPRWTRSVQGDVRPPDWLTD